MLDALLVLTILINTVIDLRDRSVASDVSARIRNFWTAAVQFFLVVPLAGLVELPSFGVITLIAVVSLFSSLGRVSWFRALSDRTMDLSRLSPFTRLSTVFVLIFAVTFLGERASCLEGIGAALIIAGSVLVSLEKPAARFREFLTNNIALILVVIFAASSASISILQKVLLTQKVPVLTTYFLLKAFQTLCAGLISSWNNYSLKAFRMLDDIRPFVVNRIWQTLAALLYLYILKHVSLTHVAPITATGPVVVLVVERFYKLRQGRAAGVVSVSPEQAARRKLSVTRISSAIIVVIGLLLFYLGR